MSDNSLFSRIVTITRANVNDLIDSASNPVVMARQVIRDTDNAISGAQDQLAELMADQSDAQRKLDQNRTEINTWDGRARLAVSKKDDASAREALTYRNNAQTVRTTLQSTFDQTQAAVKQLSDSIETLKQQRDQASAKLQQLEATQSSTKVWTTVGNAQRAIGSANDFDPHSLAHWQDAADHKLSEAQARAKILGGQSANKWQQMEQGSGVDDDLAKLKAEMGKTA